MTLVGSGSGSLAAKPAHRLRLRLPGGPRPVRLQAQRKSVPEVPAAGPSSAQSPGRLRLGNPNSSGQGKGANCTIYIFVFDAKLKLSFNTVP